MAPPRGRGKFRHVANGGKEFGMRREGGPKNLGLVKKGGRKILDLTYNFSRRVKTIYVFLRYCRV